MTLEVFSNLNDSVILLDCAVNVQSVSGGRTMTGQLKGGGANLGFQL